MRGKQGRRFSACAFGLLAAVLLWRAIGGIAGDAPAATNLPVVLHKPAPARQSPDRPRNAAPQSKLYFGSRISPVTTAVVPQNPYESNYASVLHPYHKAVIGFRFTLTSRVYMFVGVGMAVSDDPLKQGLVPNISITAAQIQNALSMQTEYGLGWDF